MLNLKMKLGQLLVACFYDLSILAQYGQLVTLIIIPNINIINKDTLQKKRTTIRLFYMLWKHVCYNKTLFTLIIYL